MKVEEIQCPVCGYYCTGKGGLGCIDKSSLLPETNSDESSLKAELYILKSKTSELQKELDAMQQLKED